jgi:phosphate transport system substrate-binding protein
VRRTLTFLATSALAASAIAVAVPAQAANTISGGGASFPYPFLSQCAADFNASQSDFAINYTSTGSGTGKTNFTKGTFVYAQTDSAYSSGAPAFGWTYVPNIGGAIAFPINLKNAKTGVSLGSAIQLKTTTLAKIMSGQIKMWNDKEILATNTRIATAIPAATITVVYRSGTSGTTNNTLQYLNSFAPTIWTKVQDDMSTAFPGGTPPASSLTGKDNATIIATINATPGAIGYVDFGDAKGYPVARIQNASGEFIAPSSASAAKNLAFQTDIDAQGLVKLNYSSKVKGAYPLAIFSYGLAQTDGKGANGLGVRQFFDYVIQKCGPSRAAQLGYVPVSGQVLAKAKQLVATIK